MEQENRQSWTLIAIAALGLVLGAIALIVAFNAKSASDDAASQDSVEEVSTELSNLVDKLGIAEESLSGEQKELRGKAKREANENRDAVSNLSNRLDKLEKEAKTVSADSDRTAQLGKQVASLERQVESLNSRLAATNERVTKLTRRVNNASSSSAGGQSAP